MNPSRFADTSSHQKSLDSGPSAHNLTSTGIGILLSREGQITAAQLKKALDIRQRTGKRLASILLDKGYIDQDTIVNVLTRKYQYQAVLLEDMKPCPEALELLPADMARAYMALPLSLSQNTLVLVMVDPTDTRGIDILSRHAGKPIHALVAREKDMLQAMETFYPNGQQRKNRIMPDRQKISDESGNFMVKDFGSLVSEAVTMFQTTRPKAGAADREDQMASGPPIIRLVNGIITRAIEDRASDIHFEPFEDSFQVRFRLDGSMYKAMNLPLTIKNPLISRIKILAQLDIAERRIPQDGRIPFEYGQGKSVDLRVSILPTLFGESVVMRILDTNSLRIELSQLGMNPDNLKQLLSCIKKPYGLILVTGPTGSGKTTTLYSILNELNSEQVKILTVEDPVEFHFKGINQVPVKEESGMSFSTALKAFLRQDPDIIMVGEIRDTQTAEIAVKAAMTGHLVFATLHTNDCPSTIVRLKDMGIPSYILAATISMVISQRLVRILCPLCKRLPAKLHSAEELKSHGFSQDELPGLSIMEASGCPQCHGTGYKGRTGLYELMIITEPLAQAIAAEAPEYQLRKMAIVQGMKSLRSAGLEKVKALSTSLEEVLRHTVAVRHILPAYLLNPETEIYQDKDVIIAEDNTDKDFFKLVQGELIVEKKGQEIARITEPGEYFGQMAAITGKARGTSIISRGRSRITRFPGHALDDIIQNYPDVARQLFSDMAKQVHAREKQLADIMNQKEHPPIN